MMKFEYWSRKDLHLANQLRELCPCAFSTYFAVIDGFWLKSLYNTSQVSTPYTNVDRRGSYTKVGSIISVEESRFFNDKYAVGLHMLF
jgi:hypothetical protein